MWFGITSFPGDFSSSRGRQVILITDRTSAAELCEEQLFCLFAGNVSGLGRGCKVMGKAVV